MVTSCCAVGCTNRRTGHSIKKPFYKIPGKKTPFAQRRRVDWINAIKRDDWKNWTYEQISNASICGDHFIGGMINYISFKIYMSMTEAAPASTQLNE